MRLERVHKDIVSSEVPTKLKETKMGDQVCEQCHEEQQVSSEVSEDEWLVDSNGKAVDPHNLPEADDHEISCYECHEMHEESQVAEKSKRVCEGCHHADVFECFTCHD